MPLKAVICDLGRTLVTDPIPQLEMNKVFERYYGDVGLSLEEVMDWFRIYLNDHKSGLQTLKEATFLGALKQMSYEHELRLANWEMMRILKVMYDRSHGDAYCLLDGAKELLAHIKGRDLLLGVVSNTAWPGIFCLDDLQRLGILDLLNSLIWSSEEGIRKHHPKLFIKSLAGLGVTKDEAVFLGDSFDRDVEGANNVGLKAIWISNKPAPKSFNGWQVKDLFEARDLLSGLK